MSRGDGAMAWTHCRPLQLTVGPFLPPYLVLPPSSKLGAPLLCLFSQVFQGLLELGTSDSSTIKKALGGCSLNPPAANFNRAADSWSPCFSILGCQVEDLLPLVGCFHSCLLRDSELCHDHCPGRGWPTDDVRTQVGCGDLGWEPELPVQVPLTSTC